jgi:uncharacterized protein (TIGR03067 family)
MLWFLLSISLSAMSASDDGGRPADGDLARAHELLAGSWEFISLTEKGETLGPALIRNRFARDGVLAVADRKMTIVSPDTGEKRSATYRIDPTKSPLQIDLVTRNDRIFRGIYKFEGENLVLCLQPGDSASRPSEFSVSEGSDRILATLTTMTRRSAARSGSAPAPPSDRSSETDHNRQPDGTVLRRAHEMLAGSWNILSIVDDGSSLGPDLIRAKFAQNGRVEIGTKSMAIVSPQSGDRRISAIRIDPSKTPSEIDLTTHFDEVLKGIYRFGGDELVLCVAKSEDDDRPTEFAAPSGSNDALFRLKMVKPAPVARPTEPVARPTPDPAEENRQKDERIKQKIGGSWSYTDSRGALTVVFRPNGTFTATRTWKSGLKRIFEGDTTTSDGRWSYGNGLLDAFITRTPDPRLAGRNYNFGLQSIGDNTMVLRTAFGELRTARRLR